MVSLSHREVQVLDERGGRVGVREVGGGGGGGLSGKAMMASRFYCSKTD